MEGVQFDKDFYQQTKINIHYTGWETTLYPPPQPQLQTSQGIYTYSIKISSMSDSCAKFHEHELIFNPLKLSSYCMCLKSENKTKMPIFLTKKTKISIFLAKFF